MLENHKVAIAEALRRGRNQAEVAEQYGVSRTAISKFCRRHAIKNGGVFVKHRHNKVAYGIECVECGARLFRDKLKAGAVERYCSNECLGKSHQKRSLDDPREAIAMRLHDISWAQISRHYGHPVQCVQMAIYRFLFANDILSDRVLARIWRRDEGRPAFSWLKNRACELLTDNARERYRNEDWKMMIVGLLRA